jgi:hypothetical protein
MNESRPWGLPDLAALVLVIAVAAGARCWYVAVATDGGAGSPLLEVQGQPPRPEFPPDTERRGQKQPADLDALVHNLQEGLGFVSLAPLSEKEETTAHVAPAYPWLLSLLARWDAPLEATVRWAQAGLGALTAALYLAFARRAFGSLLVGFLAGLLGAVHPFWIINTAELGDGVLTTFLVAACLVLGTRASQVGGPFASLLFGLALAGLVMTRAALLPFAVVALAWFLLQCRLLRTGWFYALLGFLGFANGLAPWIVRDYREFKEPIPVVDSALLHLWMGNNPAATGGPLDERSLRKALPAERLDALLGESNQARRYRDLRKDIGREITDDPGAALGRRLWAGLMFVFGENWFKDRMLSHTTSGTNAVTPPEWLTDASETALRGSLLVMITIGLLGWRWSFGFRQRARLATLAAVWLPLPYLLAHAGSLSGPRLPLDGVVLCYVAFALACCAPGRQRKPETPLARPVASALSNDVVVGS